MVKPKSFKDFLTEDESLTRKITWEEYQKGEFAPKTSEETIEDAYAAYERVVAKWNADVAG